MFKVEKVIDAKGQTFIQDPPIARFFFQSTVTAWLWLAVRLYVGYDFLDAGWHKFNTAAWMDGSGQGIIGFWKNAVAIPIPNTARLKSQCAGSGPKHAQTKTATTRAAFVAMNRGMAALSPRPAELARYA